MMESGSAGRIIDSGGAFKCPIILRLKNSSGSQVPGIQIQGVGGHASVFSAAAGRRYYTGTQSTSVVGVLYCTTALEWSGLDVKDPSFRIVEGLAACDFFGGGGFTSNWFQSTFEGFKSGGYGYQIPINASNSGSHTSSEQHFFNCNFSGDAWGVDLHGAQTGNIYFNGCEFYTKGNSNSANSGLFRNAADFLVHIVDWEGAGSVAGFVFFLTADPPHQQDANYTAFSLEHPFTDAASSFPSFIHVSGVHVGVSNVNLSAPFFGNTLVDRFGFYSAAPVSLVVSGATISIGGNGWVNWVNTTIGVADTVNITMVGRDNYFNLGSTYGIQTSGPNADRVKIYNPDGVLLSRTGTNNTTPATISGNVNNYNPGGLSYYQRWDSDASRNVTGLTFSGLQTDGERHLILNAGLNDIVLKHQSASSTAANRFYCSTGADITLTAKQSADVVYDATNSYWIVTKRN